MKGTVTISLEDYNKLIDKGKTVADKEEVVLRTAKELSVFLSFLASREDLEKYVTQFNLQSKTSKITFQGTRAMIEFRNAKD
tara:strand:+ start:267 stop:512 length:246 start_codon:yes stop_codon:yes gene_type:complete